MSDRNPEAVQFLKTLDIKSAGLGGFDKGATFASFEELSNIYESALESLRTELREKEAALHAQHQTFTTQVGEVILQQEQDRKEILTQARAEAKRIIDDAKESALRQAAQSVGDLEQMREERSCIFSEMRLIREQINRILSVQSGQPDVSREQPVTPRMSVVPDYEP